MPNTEPQQPAQAAPPWRGGIDVLLGPAEIAARIEALGERIAADYRERSAEGLMVVGVLKGAFPFFADLVRAIDLPLSCEFVRLKSYGDAKQSSGEVVLSLDIESSPAGKHVLIVEDIVDTGLSMQHLLSHLRARGAKSVAVCTLLHKANNKLVDVPLSYVGFPIPPAFVVGYGLDYCGKLRNLPYIGVVRPEAEAALKCALTGAPAPAAGRPAQQQGQPQP